MRIAAVLACAACVLMGAAPQDPPKAEAALADDLAGTLRKLRELRAGAYLRHRDLTSRIDAARQPLGRLEAETAELAAREADLDRTLAEVRGEIAKLRPELDAGDRSKATLLPLLDRAESHAKAFVVAGPPYRRDDRLLRIGGADGFSDRFGRYWTFLHEELRIARSGEAFSADVALDGNRSKPARLFRTGHLLLGFVTEDGRETGLWSGSGWAPPRTPAGEEALRAAVDILDRRRTPALFMLPVKAGGSP